MACTADGASTNRHSAGGLAHTQLSYSPSMEKVNSEDAFTHPPSPLPRSTTSHHRQKKKQWSQSDDACEGLEQTAAPGGQDRYPEQSPQSSSFLNHICSKGAAWFGSGAAAIEKFGCMVNLIDVRFCPELNCPELMYYFITEF